jgi:IPTL-CTERM motif
VPDDRSKRGKKMTYSIISRTLVLITALFLVTSMVASAQDSYDTIDPGSLPDPGVQPDNVIESVEINGFVIFLDDEDLFNNSCLDLAFEDFEDTNAPPDSVVACPNPINSETTNACYDAGALIPGFSITVPNPNDPPTALAVVPPSISGFPSIGVGPNSFANDAIITFSGFVNTVGMRLAGLGGTVDVQVFSGNDFLGSAIVNISSIDGTFLGIASKEQNITRVELVNGDGVLALDLSFGRCGGIARPIPTLSEWGLIAMAGVLGIIGLLAIRRRKLTA